jgi:hypothetical protein
MAQVHRALRDGPSQYASALSHFEGTTYWRSASEAKQGFAGFDA